MSDENIFNERWENMAKLLREVYGENAAKEFETIGRDYEKVYRLAKLLPVDRDLSLLSHRWFHTIGASQVSYMTFLTSLVDPSLVSPSTFYIAQSLFHIGFLAGHADAQGLLSDELASIDEAAACLVNDAGGIDTAESILNRLSPENVSELRSYWRKQNNPPPAEEEEEGYFPG